MKENKKEHIYIFGAHSRGRTLAVYLQYLYPKLHIEAYLYDNEEKNPEIVEGIPVLFLDNEVNLNSDYPVYLGIRGVNHAAVIEKLQGFGMKTIIPVTPELDMELRNRYLSRYFSETGREFCKLEQMPPSACVFVARSAFDQPLREQISAASFEREIQVGAALTEQRLSDGILTDHTGDNISERNRQFCELTALYWIWKNAREEIVGLEHYRRHFLLPEDWIRKMREERIDVILPTPLCVSPSVAQNYKDRHGSAEWDFMMDYLRRIYPGYHKAAVLFFEAGLYFPCNMFIMRKEVLDKLCSWLFPILFICAEHGGEKEDPYQNRYPGFLSERLISLFFEKNRERYKLVYADKNFLT